MVSYRQSPPPDAVVDLTSDQPRRCAPVPVRQRSVTLTPGPAGPPTDEDGDKIEIDLTVDEHELNRDATPSAEAQAEETVLPLPPDHETLDSIQTPDGSILHPNDTVELNDKTFLRIVFILRDTTRIVHLRGVLLMRHRHIDEKWHEGFKLHALLPLTKNELCAVLKVVPGAKCLDFNGSLVRRSLDDVKKVRDVIFTNAHFPAYSDTLEGNLYDDSKAKEEYGRLACRWKYIEEIDLKRKKVVGFSLMQLEDYESDPGKGISNSQKFKQYLKEVKSKSPPTSDDLIEVTKKDFESARKRKCNTIDLASDDEDKGSSRKSSSRRVSLQGSIPKSVKLVDSSGDEEELTWEFREKLTTTRARKGQAKSRAARPLSRKWYLYADLCTGPGGMARGAEMTGLKIKYLLEHESHACETLVLNFGEDVVLQMDLSDFAKNGTTRDIGGYHVDVMHLSLPCQPHSGANRHQNPELDHQNIALAYGTVDRILQRCKPRILTLEQVEGIMKRSGGGQHLRAQIENLTSAGYSCRWRVNNLAEYGNAQARKRVIVMAACPGQILPRWPKETHGDGSGLEPFVTVQDILYQIPRPVPGIMGSSTPRDEPPYNPNKVLTQCVTGSGGTGNLHPSGKSTFNLQELALLQGFPLHHQFCGGINAIKKQIGNAVPAVFAKALFEKSVIPALEETDAEIAAYEEKIRVENEVSRQNPTALD